MPKTNVSGDEWKSNGISTFLKIIEKFDGEKDVVEWLTRFELSAQLYGVTNLQLVMPMLLEGSAF